MALGADRKFHVLDALRGIAALAVVQFHTAPLFGGLLFHRAFLAVDFFFMLSGFVLAHAYQDRLDRGWTDGAFLRVRIVRLYPLYFLALLIGASLLVLRNDFGRHPGPIANLKVLLGFALFFLPVPPGVAGAGGFNFPLNPPMWSLFFELLANFVHALLLRRRSRAQLAIAAVVWAAALIVCARHVGTVNCGVSQNRILYGLPRIAFGYTAGMLVCACRTHSKRGWNVSPFIPAALLVAILVGPANPSLLYDLAAIFIGFPAILCLGASSRAQPWLLPATYWMGAVSYAIYVLHEPLAEWLFFLHDKILAHQAFPVPWTGFGFLCLLIMMAGIADRLYDAPVRAFLGTRPSRIPPNRLPRHDQAAVR